MFDLEQLRAALKGRNIKALSGACGIHHNVLYRLAAGTIENPEYKTIKKLSDFLDNEDGDASDASEGGA